MNSRSEERVKVAILVVDRLDAGSVDRQQLAAVQVEASAQQPTMPVPRPLVAIERASGSVREICWSGASCTFSFIARKACICWRRRAILSLMRVVLASATSLSSRSARSSAAR